MIIVDNKVSYVVEGDKVAQYAGLHLHKRIVDNHCYSKFSPLFECNRYESHNVLCQ